MTAGDIKILDNVKINQNLVCLIVSFIFLCYAKDWDDNNYSWVYDWSKWLFRISFISVCLSALFYIIEYCMKKIAKTKEHICNMCCICCCICKKKNKNNNITECPHWLNCPHYPTKNEN